MSKNSNSRVNNKVYKQKEPSKTMLVHIKCPKILNKLLKMEKLTRDLNTIEETIIQLLNEYFNKNANK